MASGATYCGTPPAPVDLAGRFNLDPVLGLALVAAAVLHVGWLRRAGRSTAGPLIGWVVAAAAFMSPLCALSVSLFAARVGQHMILVLIAAPLIAIGLQPRGAARSLWPATIGFALALWFWHMPVPYAATFRSTVFYWAMHLSLFGSGIWLWRALLWHGRDRAGAALLVGTISSLQMGLLGAVITLASWPMYAPHYLTTQAWGTTPLADQQLGGVLMWVPGCALFLWLALRSFRIAWRAQELPA